MARKVKTVTTEETIEEPQEKEINYIEDVKDQKISDPTPDSREETPIEIIEETVEPDPPIEPPIDIEKIRAEEREKVSQETTEKIISALRGGDVKETNENLNSYEKFAVEVLKKEGRNPTWDEVLPLIEDAAVQRLEAKQAESYRQQQEQFQQAEQRELSEVTQFESELNDGMNDLYRSNKLPKIKDASDPNDLGLREREALFATMTKVNTDRRTKGLAPIRDIVRIHSIYHKPTNAQPAGYDAPIGGGRSSANNPTDSDEPNYLRDVNPGAKGSGTPWWKKGF